MDTSIFGLRFKSNEALQPNTADLSAFLASPRVPGAPETHHDDLAVFLHYLALVEQFETGPYRGLGRQDVGERMLQNVLSHTRFYRPAFRLAVEEYKYHLHQLLQLDFNKPESFIRSAADEMGRLTAIKKDDQQKFARLQALIDQRKKDLEALSGRKRMITGELVHIASYVRDNVAIVQQLCEDAISDLARLQTEGDKTGQLIEDLKAHFKDEVRQYRQMGKVTPEYLESVKTEVAQLTQLLTRQANEDVAAVTEIYEGFHGHVAKHLALLRDLIARAEQVRKNDSGRDNRPFGGIERSLVALVSGFRPAVQAPEQAGVGERYEDLLREKRREMLDHVFQALREKRNADARIA